MEIMFAVVALVVLIALFGVAVFRSRRDLRATADEHRRIYRDCFLRGLSGVLAKMAAADGCASLDEQQVAEKLFRDMGLTDADRALCIDTFKEARSNCLPGSYYASIFVPYSSESSRLLVYEILWDIAAADAELAAGEEKFLRELQSWLELKPGVFEENLRTHARKFSHIDDAACAGAKRLAATFK